jgi:hypothetical protein
MVYKTQDYWVFGLCPSPGILKNTTFQKLDLFPSSGDVWKPPTLTDTTEQVSPTLHLSRKIDPFSEMFRSFCVFRIPGDGKSPKSSNPKRNWGKSHSG